MGCEQIMQRMTFILIGKDLARVTVDYDDEGKPIITIDVHEFTCKDANRIITNIIAMYRFEFTLDVIHGYSHGIAIKSMLRNDYKNKRIVRMYSPDNNPGRTYMNIV